MVSNAHKGLMIRSKILNDIEQFPASTIKDVAQRLQLNRAQVEHHIRLLRQMNKIQAKMSYSFTHPTLLLYPTAKRKTGPKKEQIQPAKPFSLKQAFATLLGAFK